MLAYSRIADEFERAQAADALDRLEEVREAVAQAIAAAREAAEKEDEPDMAGLLESLAGLLGDALGDVGLGRQIRRIDAALARYAEAAEPMPMRPRRGG
jgi:hypothetical protein